jgi:hypothetical protein
MTYFLGSSKFVGNGSLVLGVLQVVCILLALVVTVMLLELGIFVVALYCRVSS